MDRIIEVKVNGNYLFKDNKNAGVQYEANVTSLRIEFDAGWDGYAKKVTFWDAVGGNPVERTLTTDLLEDITRSTRIYLCPIPGEPLLIAGNMTFVIDGYVDGKRQRSISDKLRVKEAPFQETAGEPADPTPTQAEQLQAEIDRIQSTIQNAAQSAEDARASAEAAKNSEIVTENAKDAAETALVKAKEAQAAVETAKTEVDAAIATVESAKNAAVAAADNAKASETAAKGSEEAAKASETAAESAKTAAETAKAEAEAAKSAAEKAEANAGLWAYASAENGQLTNEARAAAQAAQAAAEAAQAGAEAARDQASAIVGGDFATKTQAQEYASTAEGNAKSYTDQKISEIPTPDVSGQIGEHNASGESHQDIRTELSGKATEQYVDDKFFVVNVASNKTADKTYAEIQAASATGKNVLAIYNGFYHYNLVMCASGVAYFSASLYVPEDGHGLMGLNIHDDGTCVLDVSAVGYTKPVVALVQTEWVVGSEQGVDAPFAYVAAASGVTGDNTVIVAPNPQYQDAYTAAGIKCVSQGTDMLLFTANSVPGISIPMNIIVLRGE